MPSTTDSTRPSAPAPTPATGSGQNTVQNYSSSDNPHIEVANRTFVRYIDYMTSATFTNDSWASATADPAVLVVDSTVAIEHAVAQLPAKSALQLVEFVRRRMAATEARVLADRFESGATDRDVEDLVREENNTSKTEAKRRARRAKATNANPGLADKLADGSLSTEQADVIADAAADTDGEAACDEELIDDISATSPEQGKKKAKSYVNKRRNNNDIQTTHNQQRRRRDVYRYRTKDGDHVLAIQGDETSIDEIERHINTGADAEYQADGGRDLPGSKHPRSHSQRRFDAAHKLLTNPNPHSDSGSGAGSKKAPGRSSRDKRRSGATIIVTTVADLKDIDSAVFTTADGNRLPGSVVHDLMWDASWIGQVYSAEGEVLWQGRSTRYATPAQVTGLIARDGGCVLCSAHYDRCEAHHCDPWEAPMAGETNIDRLALLCKPCHTDLHQRKRTLYFDRTSRSWKTRQARWEETPPEPHTLRTKPYPHERQQNRRRNDPTGKHRNKLF